MSTLNKDSVREEVERIKTQFDQLSADNKMTTECKVLMQSMIRLITLILSIFLEKTTVKNNKNSSKPSSQTEKGESALARKCTNGKDLLESDMLANNTRTIETVSIAKVEQCTVCRKDLSKTPFIFSGSTCSNLELLFMRLPNKVQ